MAARYSRRLFKPLLYVAAAGTAGGAKRPLSSWEQSVADVMLPIDKKITDWFNSW